MKVARKFKTAVAGTVFGGSLLFTAGLGAAAAEPDPGPDLSGDGLVTVTQGDAAVAENVSTEEAVSTVAQLCGGASTDTGNMAELVDTEGVSLTACAGVPGGDVLVVQNAAAEEPAPPIEFPEPPAADEGVGATWDPI